VLPALGRLAQCLQQGRRPPVFLWLGIDAHPPRRGGGPDGKAFGDRPEPPDRPAREAQTPQETGCHVALPEDTTYKAWARASRAFFYPFFSEVFDWDTPPFFKSFLRLEATESSLVITCYGVTDRPEHEENPPVEDRVEVRLDR
jgi:hypothetical protein